MPFKIVRDDITHVPADAIVNAANEQLRRGGGVCGAIFEAAGEHKLQRACDKIGHCNTGDAVITRGYRLPARYVIHAVGPIWQGGSAGERELLARCYRRALELAVEHRCRSIAFPLISAGIYGYPRHEALQVAQDEIRAFLNDHELEVTLVLYDPTVMQLADDLRLRVDRYIDDTYVDEHRVAYSRLQWEQASWASGMPDLPVPDSAPKEPLSARTDAAAEAPATTGTTFCSSCGARIADGARFCTACGKPLTDDATSPYTDEERSVLTSMPQPPHQAASAAGPSMPAQRRRERTPGRLRSMLRHLDASFSETLLAMIDERGFKDADVYKRANISRQHFSKMRSNPRYRPTKTTVLALSVALQLTLEETSLLLERAGFALSHADKRDVIVEFFICEGNYDIFQINDVLFAYDQPLLG